VRYRGRVARFLVRESLGVASLALALLWAAGTAAWWPAWALVAITAAWVAATTLAIRRVDPGLFAERLGLRKGAKRWDRALMGAYGMLYLATLIVAGLDHRHGWTVARFPAAQLCALAACALGYGLVAWATASNAFFSQIVRIQTERGHTVATGGPYRIVRHPAYLGSVLMSLATPVLLGSLRALVPAVPAALLLLLRTALEDRTLQAELPGYPDYAARVRHRLLPGVW